MAPDLRLHRHVMPRYAYPPRPVDDRAPQRARRLKADEQYGRFTPAEIVAKVMTDAARLAHARCGADDRARQVVEPHRFSAAAHDMQGRMPDYLARTPILKMPPLFGEQASHVRD